MSVEVQTWIAIVLAALLTLGTRVLGPLLMARVPPTARVQGFLDTLSSSVIVAIVAGYLARGTLRELAALAVGAVTMALLRKPLLSMLVTIAVAAVFANWRL